MIYPDLRESVPTQRAIFPAIVEALASKNDQRLVMQLSQARTDSGKEFDLKVTMHLFTQKKDLHSLDILYREWRNLKQRSGESIYAFHVRFTDLIKHLARQKYQVPDMNAWVHFRNSIIEERKVREERDVNSIETALEFIGAGETSNLATSSSGSVVNTLRSSFNDSDRCPVCHRLPQHHKRGTPGSNCSIPARSLADQKAWERSNLPPPLGKKNGKKRKRRSGGKGSKNFLNQTINMDVVNSLTGALDGSNKKLKITKKARKFLKQKLSNNDSSQEYPGNKPSKHAHVRCQHISWCARAAADTCLMCANAPNSACARDNLQHLACGLDCYKSAVKQGLNAQQFRSASVCRVGEDTGQRNMCMANVEIKSGYGQYERLPALFDTGAHPSSYVSVDVLSRLGLTQSVRLLKKSHQTAGKGQTFTSQGTIPVEFRLPNKKRFTATLIVADISTEIIFGTDLLRRLGCVIDMNKNVITCTKLARCKLPMLRLDQWNQVSNISASDFFPR